MTEMFIHLLQNPFKNCSKNPVIMFQSYPRNHKFQMHMKNVFFYKSIEEIDVASDI